MTGCFYDWFPWFACNFIFRVSVIGDVCLFLSVSIRFVLMFDRHKDIKYIIGARKIGRAGNLENLA